MTSSDLTAYLARTSRPLIVVLISSVAATEKSTCAANVLASVRALPMMSEKRRIGVETAWAETTWEVWPGAGRLLAARVCGAKMAGCEAAFVLNREAFGAKMDGAEAL
jgi:hypothetical protein